MNDTDQKNSRLWLTINPKGVNKLETLQLLCKNLKTNTNKVVFFGDGENDIKAGINAGCKTALLNAENMFYGQSVTVPTLLSFVEHYVD